MKKSKALGIIIAVVGFTLIVIGIWGSFPKGPLTSPLFAEPIVLGGIVIFIIGLIVFLFLSITIYTVVPDSDSTLEKETGE